ncbi:MAG: hypothetical protein LBP63_02095 [Prevotellaceae bacterium]|jgi:hypothetical protein|nr:hypothetical protein [Prevotellaceae bacterium]
MKGKTITICILLVIVLVLTASFCLQFATINDVMRKLADNNIWASLIIGMASSLIVFMLTYSLTRKDDMQEMEKSIKDSVSVNIQTIHNNAIFLMEKNVHNLNEKGYYDSIYNSANLIQICGMAPKIYMQAKKTKGSLGKNVRTKKKCGGQNYFYRTTISYH